MKQLFLLLLVSLLPAGIIFAQKGHTGSGANPQRAIPEKNIRQQHPPQAGHAATGINLSLWKNVSTQRTDTVGRTCLNIGIFSSMNSLSGLGVNVLGSVTGRNANGIQLAGLSNTVGGSMRGVQLAGITNINGDRLRGLSVAGLVGITGDCAQGIVISGLTNISGNEHRGASVGGLLNINGEGTSGMHLAGLAHVAGGSFKGFSGAGLLSVVGKELQGMQLASLANICVGNVTGLQLAALSNVAGGTVRGAQIGIVNTALRAKGLQIGLFNYYTEQLDGFQLGLVNANPKTQIQMMLFGGNATKLNIGARFKNRLFYTILGGGTHYLDFGDKFSAAVFYRAGLEFPLCKRLFLSGDMGYQHIETFKNKDYGIPARLYALQARINLEYHLTDRLGLFLTGGYGGSRHYTRNQTYDKGVIVEGGVVLLKM